MRTKSQYLKFIPIESNQSLIAHFAKLIRHCTTINTEICCHFFTIDENKCSGCSACAAACHMGAIGMVDGKAKVLREDCCDGLGRCLPVCPTGQLALRSEKSRQPLQRLMQKTYSLKHWPADVPVQIKLVPISAPYFHNANLLVAADCAAYAYGK